ncbi:MAG: sugar phosphate isomerase/epimerase [Planctomycetes bacterium]|nr:sugar phosphate isomerase/epimerase [Planctomycetota bacterium]
MFRLGYNTNGLAHHRVEDALRLLARLGYRGVAITPDVGQLDLYRLDRAEVRRVKRLARELDLALVLETGARFLMDAEVKHAPTLLAQGATDRTRRVDFLRRSIDLAHDLDASVVSLWAGAHPEGQTGDPAGPTPGTSPARSARTAPPPKTVSSRGRTRAAMDLERAWDRLVDGLVRVLDHARGARVGVGFEPEPGMFVERPTGYLELRRRLGERAGELGLTLDVGHLLATLDLPVEAQIEALAPYLVGVQLDDAPRGRHEHRPFGQGDLDLPAVLAALKRVRFEGLAAVELSRDSHRGPDAAREALAALRRARRGAVGSAQRPRAK